MDSYRTRSRITGAGRAYLHTEYMNAQGVVTQTYDDAQTYLGKNETINDWNHPGFKRRSESGEIVMGTLSIGKEETVPVNGFMEFPEGSSRTRYTGDLFSAFNRINPPPRPERNSSLQSLRDLAAISALKKLNTADVDSGEILGTLAQTVEMFRRPFSSISKHLSKMEKVRNRRFSKYNGGERARDWSKLTADVWLEHSFGWRPIFQDIGSVMRIYDEKVAAFQNAVRVARGSAKSGLSHSSSGTYIHGGENRYTGMKAETSWQVKTKLVVGAGVYYQIPLGKDADYFARRLGLGFNNLPVSAWNLLPHSWVVDQIVGVGDWIQACFPDPDLIIRGKWITDVEVVTSSAVMDLSIYRAEGNNSPRWYSGDGGGRNQTVTSINRLLTFDLPSLPQFNPHLGNIAIALNNAAYGFNQMNRMIKRWG